MGIFTGTLGMKKRGRRRIEPWQEFDQLDLIRGINTGTYTSDHDQHKIFISPVFFRLP